jgi:hypothetical protein
MAYSIQELCSDSGSGIQVNISLLCHPNPHKVWLSSDIHPMWYVYCVLSIPAKLTLQVHTLFSGYTNGDKPEQKNVRTTKVALATLRGRGVSDIRWNNFNILLVHSFH